MREPTPGVDWGEYVTIIFASVLASILAGIGSAMAWFRSEKKALRMEMDELSSRMTICDERHGRHETDLAVIQACQENTAERLESIVKTLDRIHDKLDVMQTRR